MDVALGGDVGIKSLDALCLGERCERADIHDLGLASREHGAAVNSRDQTHFRMQRTDLGEESSVGALVVLEDHLADGELLILVDRIAKLREILLVVRKGLCKALCDVGDVLLSGLLVIGEDRNLHLLRRNDLLDVFHHLVRHVDGDVILLLLSALVADHVVEGKDLLVHRICLIDVVDHVAFRHLIGTGLDHHDLVSCRSDGQAKISVVPLLLRGVDDDTAVDKANLGRDAGARKRDIGDVGCKGCTHHRDELRTAGRIHGHDHALEGDIIAHVLRKQRAHRAVDDTARQNRVLGCLALALVEAAGHLADRIVLLGIFHGEREEVHAVSGLSCLGCRAQNGRIPVVHERAAVCLLADASDINGERSARQFHRVGHVPVFFFPFEVCHIHSPLFVCEGPSSSFPNTLIPK